MAERFFLENPVVNDTATLDGDQARHAVSVMRYSPGDSIVLFDGAGREFKARIGAVKNKSVSLVIEETILHTRPVGPILTLAVALPKGDRQRFLIEKLVELGVDRFIPLKTERSVSIANSNVLDRFQKWTIEACKQCGRNFLMEISREQSIAGLIRESSGDGSASRFVADPRGNQPLHFFRDVEAQQNFQKVVVAIGPEGGFADSELEHFLNSGWESIRMGDTILRIETAAIYAAVAFR